MTVRNAVLAQSQSLPFGVDGGGQAAKWLLGSEPRPLSYARSPADYGDNARLALSVGLPHGAPVSSNYPLAADELGSAPTRQQGSTEYLPCKTTVGWPGQWSVDA